MNKIGKKNKIKSNNLENTHNGKIQQIKTTKIGKIKKLKFPSKC